MNGLVKLAYGCLGGIVALLIAIVVMTGIADPIDYTPKRIFSAKASNIEEYLSNDSMASVKIEFLKDMENRGVLLTPEEYTGHMLQFYSTLVAVLVGLFVVFSFLSFFILNDSAKKSIERKVGEIDKEIKNQVIVSLKDVMRDSREFDERLSALVKKFISEEHVSEEDISTIKNDLKECLKNIDALFIIYEDIDERISESDNII